MIADPQSPQALAFQKIAAALDATLKALAGDKPHSTLDSLIKKIKKPTGGGG